ncbi:hypothetical protein [Vibrio sp. D431a]|uniref:hypothetical protein n=1 Tax=Vibrio sp. D431a TaxID=2837388 RepID=UPI002556605B|nr:hypothetical protein [Vibrio sp. D431a]MDK9790060.1 hypothetical protein [Vibrio sp. D431a]
MKFKSYTSTLDLATKVAKKEKISLPEMLHLQLSHFARNLGSNSILHTLNFSIMACEYDFLKSDKNIVFIEDQYTINKLMNLEFTAKIATIGYFPFKTFTLSLPNVAKSGNLDLLPCLISICTPDEYKTKVIQFMKEGLALPDSKIESILDTSSDPAYENEQFIRMIIPTRSENGIAHTFSGFPVSKLPTILNTPIKHFDRTLYNEIFGLSSSDAYELDKDDILLQLTMLRLIAAMFIYNKVTDNKYFRTGVPKGCLSPKHMGLLKELGNASNKYVFSRPQDKSDSHKVSTHVRSEHIRQFTSERYYKGEFSSIPIGERFVLVKETLVGEGQPYTQGSDKS